MSVVSPWEVAIKARADKLRLPQPPLAWFSGLVERYGLRELALDSAVACRAAALPLIHRDPFDRVLVAVAETHSLVILTSDEDIAKYPGTETVW